MNIDSKKGKSLKEVREQLLTNPKFRKAYYSFDLPFEIAQAVIELRVQQGWTQEKLAQKTGLKQSAIARLENGGVKSVRLLNKIALALKKKVEIKFT